MEWIDVLPDLPLARAVPIRMEHYIDDLDEWHACYMQDQCMRDSETTTVRDDAYSLLKVADFLAQDPKRRRVRVDLDDPQGFAYGLRLLVDAKLVVWAIKAWFDHVLPVLVRWIRDETTEVDKLWLATALAELQ